MIKVPTITKFEVRNARVQSKDDLARKFVTECLFKVKTSFRPIWYMVWENRAGKWCIAQWKQMQREREREREREFPLPSIKETE